MSLPVVCQAEPWTGRLKVDFEQSKRSQNKNFVIKIDRRILSENPSNITETNRYAGSDFPPNDNRQNPCAYWVKMTTIESISWQWLYATNLLVAYELILTIKDKPLNSNDYSWLPVEVIVGWLLRSYWNPDSPVIKPIELQSASILTQENQPFVIITSMFGSGHNSPQYLSSEPSGQQAPQATNYPTGYFTHFLYSDSGNGNEDPEQDSHTLGLNCFVYPCHGVCQLRPASDGSGPAEWTLNSEKNSTDNTEAAPGCISNFDSLTARGSQPQTHRPDDTQLPGNVSATSDDLIIISGLLNLGRHSSLEKNVTSFSLAHFTTPMGTSETQQTTTGSSQLSQSPPHLSRTGKVQTKDKSGRRTCHLIVVRENGQSRSCGKVCNNAQALTDHKRRHHSKQQTCDVTIIRQDGQPGPCRTFCKNARALSSHKNSIHSGQQSCHLTVVKKDGQLQLCRTVCKTTKALSDHRRRHHSRQQTCDISVAAQDGQQRPCGKVCNNAQALTDHKRRHHSGQRTCGVTAVGQDGQTRPCGAVCKNAKALTDHRRRHHSRPQTCDISVAAQDGQQRPCGKVCNNAHALTDHKRRHHSRQRTCDVTVVGQDGQTRPCGAVCKNAKAITQHNTRYHTGPKTCDMIVVGQLGQPRLCGVACKNAEALSTHKSKIHREQKTCHSTVAGEDCQQRPRDKVCKNARTLLDQKRMHRKRKPADGNQNDDLSLQEGEVSK
ncbi:hypothetical protein [Endozoicomonas sp. 8E]|uniref:hypothetical protein n=1 Tax=Endozoicomonas sp. 8E TaxID=3035692 RepID=UPI002938ED6B|nr:hypothetical protein [Endozoicomonas sp. 8E]WOG27120.1 hypothetical protein P6910_21595 [Endozoicomonas sp. 8E]